MEEYAHFMEHMPFRKTKHYSNAMGHFVSAGLVRGVDINAGTGGEYTFFG